MLIQNTIERTTIVTEFPATDVRYWQREPNRASRKHAIISVIIPTLTEEKLIQRAKEIFTNELCEEYSLELIVSDGGSKDSTTHIAQQFADVIVQHTATRRQTISEGRNRGAEIAGGETLVFINADTIPAEPRVFFKFVHDWTLYNGKYKNSNALACPVEVMPSERKWSDVLFHNFFNSYLKVLSLIGAGVGRGECQIVRKEVFNYVGGYKSLLIAGEDFELFNRVAKHNQISIINELLVYESPRRYRKFGYPRILWQWFVNFIGATLFQRSFSKEWEPVR